MMCRLGIVGLEEEVSSHVYLEFGEVFHTGLESSNNMEYFIGLASRLAAIDIDYNFWATGTPEGIRRTVTVSHKC
jgi:hypothetical protein